MGLDVPIKAFAHHIYSTPRLKKRKTRVRKAHCPRVKLNYPYTSGYLTLSRLVKLTFKCFTLSRYNYCIVLLRVEVQTDKEINKSTNITGTHK